MVVGFITLALAFPLQASREPGNRPLPVPFTLPVPVTAEAEPVSHAAVSGDGRWVVYTATRASFPDLWLRPLEADVSAPPRRLTDDPADETEPAFSPDGSRLAYVSTAFDVKGDIFVLDLTGPSPVEPVRLTDRATADGAPCFSPDGTTLYFHRRPPGQQDFALYALDLSRPDSAPTLVDTGGHAMHPAASPDGRRLAFQSRRADANGDIFVLNLDSGAVQPATTGPYMDGQPCWDPKGTHLFFTRIAWDSNRDGRLDATDTAAVYTVDASTAASRAYPVTPGGHNAFRPAAGGARLFFLSDRGGSLNFWALPPDGIIPPQQSAPEQYDLARRVSAVVPFDPDNTILAYWRVLERFPENARWCARAAYEIGALHLVSDRFDAAEAAFALVTEDYGEVQPEAGLAAIHHRVIETRRAIDAAADSVARASALHSGLSAIGRLADGADAEVRARNALERARLRFAFGRDATEMTGALALVEAALKASPIRPGTAAEAWLLKGEMAGRMGDPRMAEPPYRTVIQQFPDTFPWADTAVERLLSLEVPAGPDTSVAESIARLRSIAAENARSTPMLAAGALNRTGDMLYAANDWTGAKSAYAEALGLGEKAGTQATAARMALAEILYKEERFRQALDLYEKEMALRSYADPIYLLARRGYIAKSIAAGEQLFRYGEVAAARKKFSELIGYDDSVVAAHRGYIKCAAAAGTLPAVRDAYAQRLKETGGDPVYRYAAALCLTYGDDPDALARARQMLERAIEQNGRNPYAFQTLGYVLEVLETVHHKEGLLERALSAYQKAAALNDPVLDPDNAAHLWLNIGNIHFLLGQYRKAFDAYDRRMAAEVPFDDPDTEILFYRRLGAAGFQLGESDRTIAAFTRALALIASRIHPTAASDALVKIHRYAMDRIVAPALKTQGLEKAARQVADRQSGIFKTAGRLTEAALPPPDPAWSRYRDAMERLLKTQQDNMEAIVSLARRLEDPETPADQTREQLAAMIGAARRALSLPERLVALKAELLDRLALAYQDAEAWEQAAGTFAQVFELNQRRGSQRNLSRNLRGKAYNTYMLAGTRKGAERERLLAGAGADFARCVELVERYGVPPVDTENTGALLNLSFQVALDGGDATGAARGFTAEQEKRLARVFVHRIALEMGEVESAGDAIRSQLSPYAEAGAIRESDRYGVSLLYHRAGLVDAARRQHPSAFDDFERSAMLCLEMRTPVSAAINVVHMAGILEKIPATDPAAGGRLERLERLDRKVSDLLAQRLPALETPVAATYHNAMGIFWTAEGIRQEGAAVADAVSRMRRFQRGGVHFNRGIRLLEPRGEPPDRRRMGLLASLHLNASDLAAILGEQGRSVGHLEQAHLLAQRCWRPDLAWRALARLGRLEAALETAETVTFLNAGCGPGEIVAAFAPLVTAATQNEGAAAGFNLAERISELERYNRTAFVVRNAVAPDTAFWQGLYPLLDRIRQIEEALAAAPESEKPHLAQRLDEERALLANRIGPDGENLPELLRTIREPALRETVWSLAAVAARAESEADRAVATGRVLEAPTDSGATDTGSIPRAALATRYREIRQQALDQRPENRAADLLTLFGPEPWDDMAVFESLGKNGTLYRLFPAVDPAGQSNGKWWVFTLESGAILARRTPSPAAVLAETAPDRTGPVFIAVDDPADLPATGLPASTVFSGSHLFRTWMNRKPFKWNLLAFPQIIDAPAPYRRVPAPPEDSGPAWNAALAAAQTLVLADAIALRPTVPTRPNEPARTELSRVTASGRHIPLSRLLGRVDRLSAALLPGAGLSEAYLIGHLFALFGCPSVLIPETPDRAGDFVHGFLAAYAEATLREAWESAQGPGAGWRAIGYAGMDAAEAAAFAQEHFNRYVEQGVAAYKDQRFGDALAMLQDAIQTAEQSPPFAQHLAALCRLARECAFADGRTELAAEYGARLAGILDQEAPDSEAHADALWRLGLIEARRQRFEAAVAHLETAVEMLANLDLGARQADVLDSLGIVFEDTADYEAALDRFEAAEALSRNPNRTAWAARQHENIGRILDLRMSRYAAAVGHYRRARELYTAAGQTENAVQSLVDMGRCHRLMGNFAEADRLYSEAAGQVGEGPVAGKILMEQANNAWFQARYETAFRLQRKVLEMAARHAMPLLELNALNTAGLIWWTLGDYPRALSELEAALAAARKLENRRDEIATTLNNMGLVYRESGRYTEALDAFEQALSIDTAINSPWAIAYDLRNQGLTYLKMDRAEQAVPLLERAASMAQSIGNRINAAKAILGLADARRTLGDMEASRADYETSLSMAREMSLPETQWRALYGLAMLQLASDPHESEALLRQAAAVIEGMRADIRIDRLKDSFIGDKLMVYEALVTLLADRGAIRESFEVAERSRARNFIDLLGNQRLSLNRAVDQDRYDRVRTLRSRIAEYEGLASQSTEPDAIRTYRDTLKNLQRDLDNALLEIQAENPQLAALVSVDPIGLDRLNAIMEPDVGLLAYYVLPNEIFCWTLRRNGIHLFRSPLGRDSLDLEIRDYRRAIQNLEPVEAMSQRFHRLLIAPALAHLGGCRYVGIIPHGPLHYLSYATLSDGGDYLIDRFPLFHLPNASVLDYTLKRRNHKQKNPEVLAIGNPDLGNPALDLPFAEHEVRTLKWNFPRITLLTRERATEDWVVDNIGRFGIIHLASHGEFDPINPLFSAVRLARGDAGDGKLEAAEVFGLTINADLVVLSACQTGLGKITRGDDVIGMNRSFFYAGTHAIISSLWRVSDTSTAILIKEFYRRYVSANKAESLNRAMIHVRRSYPHPGYWGAFTLVGDYF